MKWQCQNHYNYEINRKNLCSFTLIISNRVELRWTKTTNAEKVIKIYRIESGTKFSSGHAVNICPDDVIYCFPCDLLFFYFIYQAN